MKFVQVGVGKMGQTWLGVLADHPDMELVGIVEPVETLRSAAIARIGLDPASAYASLDDAITGHTFDAAVVVTPPSTHRPISEQLLRAGKHVLQEKPLATSPEDARSLVDIAAETGASLMVAQNYRHSGPYRTVRAVVESGRLGPIIAVSIRFAKDARTMFGEGDFRYQMTHPLLVDMSIHHFDMLRGLLGSDPVQVYAQSWHVPDGNYAHHAAATVLFRMGDGVPVSYAGNWATSEPETSWNGDWQIIGEHGRLVWSSGDGQGEIITVQEHGRELEPVPLVDALDRGQVSLITSFVRAIHEGREPETSAADNIRSLGMVLGAVESADTGAVVTLA